jgi:hypothetical protein
MILPLLLALSSLVVTPERPISPPLLQPAAGDQQQPAVASDGDGFLAAWRSEGQLVAARLDGDGALLDPAPLLLGKNALGDSIAVAGAPDGALVAWSDATTVQARFVGARDGQLTPAVTLAVAAGQIYDVNAAYAGGRFLVTWAQNSAGGVLNSGILLDSRGNPVSRTFKVMEGTAAVSSIAAGASDFLVAGDLLPNVPLTPRQAFAVRVGTDGSAGAPIIVSDPGVPVFELSVRAVWTGSDYFVAWSRGLAAVGDTSGARVAADGSVTRTGAFYAGTAKLAGLTWTGSGAVATLRDTAAVVTQRVSGGAPAVAAPRAPLVSPTAARPRLQATK